jgi:hypothetical protein
LTDRVFQAQNFWKGKEKRLKITTPLLLSGNQIATRPDRVRALPRAPPRTAPRAQTAIARHSPRVVFRRCPVRQGLCSGCANGEEPWVQLEMATGIRNLSTDGYYPIKRWIWDKFSTRGYVIRQNPIPIGYDGTGAGVYYPYPHIRE